MRSRSFAALLAVVALVPAACGKDSTGPSSPRVQLGVLAGDVQFGLPGTTLAEPLQVVATDGVTEEPVAGVSIEWRVVSGSATVLTAVTTTNASGVASTQLRLGDALGSYVVEATTTRLLGDAPRFEARAVERPVIQSVAPTAAAAGDTLTITGLHFNPITAYHDVFFAGVAGHVVSSTATSLRVVVPACVPTRTVDVTVALGAVVSEPYALAAVGGAVDELALAPGEALLVADPENLACLRFPGGVANAAYLVVLQNAATVYGVPMPFQLTTLNGTAPGALALLPAAQADAATSWESRLRAREAELFGGRVEGAVVTGQSVEPELGDRRSFQVLNADQSESVTITAEVRAISTRAIFYVDLAAPAQGYSSADLARFGELFDDPIYPTGASVFGAPSDIDANGHIIILFTPRVNALTPRGEASYIAGYFYGCDLVSRTRCPDTNSGEIFYSLVPDPQGQFSDPRGAADLVRSVPPVLAHEFQHMISFARRGETLDALWLSEALAHTAEDVVGDVFAQRGELTLARDFRRPNYLRAHRWLSQVDDVSMIAEDGQGSVELRGAGWLFLRYLRGHYGGNTLLAGLTQTTLSSTANVVARTGQAWSGLLSDFGLALYADEAPELAGLTIDARHTFPDFNPRTAITQEVGTWPLTRTPLTLGDGGVEGQLPSSSTAYVQVNAPAGSSSYPAVNMVFAGLRGGPFRTGTVPQLSILRQR